MPELMWTVAGGWGTIPSGAETYEGMSPEEMRAIPGAVSGLTEAQAMQEAGYAESEAQYVAAKVAPPSARPVPYPLPAQGMPYKTNGAMPLPTLPGTETEVPVSPLMAQAGVTAAPMVAPLVAPVIAGAGIALRFLSVAVLKRILLAIGPKALKIMIGAMAFKELMDWIGIGGSDDHLIGIRKAGKKRYSIGSNPRVGTLAKVSRHCKSLLRRHEKVIREFLPKKQPRYGIPPAKALSAIEKAAIRG